MNVFLARGREDWVANASSSKYGLRVSLAREIFLTTGGPWLVLLQYRLPRDGVEDGRTDMARRQGEGTDEAEVKNRFEAWAGASRS